LAQDWPQWRGPNRDGTVSGFTAPAAWPAKFMQKWQVKAGKGDASPVLVGENVYTFGRQGTDEVVLCLVAATGKTVWEAKYPAGRVVTGPPAGHPGPRGTPVVAEGKICTLGVGSVLSCFDAAKGTLLWRKQTAADYGVASINTDCTMSPTIVDGLCIIHVGDGSAGAVIALALADGKPKWTWKSMGVTNSSPVVMTAGGKKQLVILTGKDKQSGTLAGLDLADGKLLWQTSSSQGDCTTPIVDGATVICSGQGSKGMFAVKIAPQDAGFAATPLWANSQAGARFTTPVLKDGLLYGFNGSFFCADAKTGATLWTDSAKRGQSASLLAAGSVVLALTVKGELIAFTPSNAKYTQLALIKVASAETWAHPVVAGDRIFVKDTETVSLWTLAP
jgi:outer membrane protein assembly factor BamB